MISHIYDEESLDAGCSHCSEQFSIGSAAVTYIYLYIHVQVTLVYQGEVSMEWIILLSLALAVTLYTVIGAVVFTAVEGPHASIVEERNLNITSEIKGKLPFLLHHAIEGLIITSFSTIYDCSGLLAHIPTKCADEHVFWSENSISDTFYLKKTQSLCK